MRNVRSGLTAALSLGVLGVLVALPAAAADPAPTPTTNAVGNLGAGVDASAPAKLVQTAAMAMLKDLDAHRADYRANPGKVHALVDQVLLPHFDTALSAKLVMGRHWRDANDDQKKRFVDAFYRSLLNNYGDALVDLTADKLQVLPYTGDPKAENATVRTKVRRSDGSSVEVDYALHRTEEGWKAWDVIIEGISYVRSFREDFDAEIDQKGIDEVIKRLQSGETPQAIKNTSNTVKKS
jgi:phospholipid transport system substrate-binding protein